MPQAAPARSSTAGASGLSAYAPEQVEKVTGVAASRVERLARQFADTRPAVAIIGGPPLAHTNGLFSALAVNALNALVGSVEQPGGLFFTPQLNLPPRRSCRASRCRRHDRSIGSRRTSCRRCAGPQVLLRRRSESCLHGTAGMERP